MTTSVNDLYKAMLDDSPSYDVQRLVLERGLATKDGGLLTLLARVVDLDPDIDEALGALSNVTVQAAYVTRPGRDPNWLSNLAIRDRRAGIHLALAKLEGLSDAAYTVIAASTSRAVTMALMMNESAPLDARRTAAYTASTTLARVNRNERELWESCFKKYSELRDPMIIGAHKNPLPAWGPSPLHLLQRSEATSAVDDLNEEAFEVLVTAQADEIVDLRTSEHNYVGNYDTAMSFTYVLAQMPRLTKAQRVRLLAAFEKGVPPKIMGGSPMKVTTEEVLTQLKTPPTAYGLTRLTVSQATSIEDLEEKAHQLSSSTPDAQGIAGALVAHRLATTALVHRVRFVCGITPSEVAIRRALSVHGTDSSFVIELMIDRVYPTMAEITRTNDPRGVLKELLQRTTSANIRSHLLRLLDRDTIGLLPCCLLESIGEEKQPLVAKFLLARFGTNPRAWTIFEDYLPTAYGALEDLVEQVTIIYSLE